jgi:hypothetical protein
MSQVTVIVENLCKPAEVLHFELRPEPPSTYEYMTKEDAYWAQFKSPAPIEPSAVDLGRTDHEPLLNPSITEHIHFIELGCKYMWEMNQ